MAASLVETAMNMTDVVDLIDADPTRKRLLKFQTETPPMAVALSTSPPAIRDPSPAVQ
jgi:hypothetical protein